jgi:PIN domain nuclease of toxin-antitoxin system
MLLLDTCALLWLVGDKRKLTAKVQRLFQLPETRLYVSAISAFEISVKARRGALVLPLPPDTWYTEALAFHGLEEIPVTGAIAARSAMLPPHHMDPCDRIIVATAQNAGIEVVTPDKMIAKYEVGVAW